MTESKTGMSFSRRNFIKGAAALTATGALVGCSPQTENLSETGSESPSAKEVPETQIFSGVCRGNCAGGCFLDVHVRDGQVVRTTSRDLPDARYNRICSKGLSLPARIYSAKRLQYPMKRTGERGEGQFERISWDEAFDEIATKWKQYSDEFGPASMAIMSASGNYAILSGVGMGAMIDRFKNVVGASTIMNNVDAAHGFIMGRVTGMGFYGTQNEPADMLNSDAIICWGANPTVSQPQVMHFILEAKEGGTQYVVIDPAFNANAAKADWYIPINPSTDGALALGLLDEIFNQGWEDLDFVRDHTEAPLLIKEDGTLLRMSDMGVEPTTATDPATGAEVTVDPYVVWDESAGTAVALEEATAPAITNVPKVNGMTVRTTYDNLKRIASDWTLSRTSKVTGIPEEDIKRLAAIYHDNAKVNTYAMFGDNHYINGHYNYWPIYCVSMMTGHIGNEGNACGFAELLPLVGNIAATTFPVDASGNPCQGAGPEYIDNKINAVLDTGNYGGWKPTETYDATLPASANVDTSADGDPTTPLKGAFIACANPATNHAAHDTTVAWLKKLEFVVVAENSMTETAKYADILLPVAHWFEQIDMFNAYGSQPYVLLQEKAIDPLYECKTDFEIYKEIGTRLGYGEFFDITEDEFLRTWVESDMLKERGVTYEQFLEDKTLRVFPTDNYIGFEGGVFATGTGRGRLYDDAPVPAYNIGQPIDFSREVEPYWEPALEADVNSEARKTYPFNLLSEHMRTRTHSQWWDVGLLKEFEPEPVIKMNPADAEAKGIVEGDEVRVFNGRGSVVMKAVINAGLPQGMVAAPRAFQAEEFVEGHFASLPTNEFNQAVANMSFNDVAVDIEKL